MNVIDRVEKSEIFGKGLIVGIGVGFWECMCCIEVVFFLNDLFVLGVVVLVFVIIFLLSKCICLLVCLVIVLLWVIRIIVIFFVWSFWSSVSNCFLLVELSVLVGLLVSIIFVLLIKVCVIEICCCWLFESFLGLCFFLFERLSLLSSCCVFRVWFLLGVLLYIVGSVMFLVVFSDDSSW